MKLTGRCPHGDYFINFEPLEATARLPKINVRIIIWGIVMHVDCSYYFYFFLEFFPRKNRLD